MLLSLTSAAAAAAEGPPAYSGRDSHIRVAVPRIEAQIEVDGMLDEPVWEKAVRLVGFSQYAPVDGRAAEDDTEVLVWYSPSAIHFGVRAHAVPGSVRASLANRDHIDAEDSIQIFLASGREPGPQSRLRVRLEGPARTGRLRGRDTKVSYLFPDVRPSAPSAPVERDTWGEGSLEMLIALAAIVLGLVVGIGLAWLALTGVLALAFRRARTFLRRITQRRRAERPDSPERRNVERRAH